MRVRICRRNLLYRIAFVLACPLSLTAAEVGMKPGELRLSSTARIFSSVILAECFVRMCRRDRMRLDSAS